MSKLEILAELPRLELADRRVILDRIWELEEHDLIAGRGAITEDQALLDRELEDFHLHPHAGSDWTEVKGRVRNASRSC